MLRESSYKPSAAKDRTNGRWLLWLCLAERQSKERFAAYGGNGLGTYFKHILEKYNDIYRVPLPKITPHVCRHTFCTNRANENMGIKQLQYLMGHSDISVTMDTYAHIQHEAAREELLRLEEQGKMKTKIVQFA